MFKCLKLVVIFLFLMGSFAEAAQLLPELSNKEVKRKLDEIMSAHAEYKKLEPKIVKRALVEYIEELDPTKTYFIESEIGGWISPSDEFINALLADCNKGNYQVFTEIFQKMVHSIARRESFEKEILATELPKNVSINEFKNLTWAKNEAELKERLLRVKSLQLETATKLNDESPEKTMQRIRKKRAKKEEAFLTSDLKERNNLIYSLILKAGAAALDSHTSYFTPSEAEQFLTQVQLQQRLFGLGVQIRDDLNGFTVVKIIEGGPASNEKKLRTNDRIVAVDKEPVIDLDVVEVVELIRGVNGSKVELTVLREQEEGEKKEEKLDITVTRGEVVLNDTRIESSFEPFGDGGIGFIKLYSFYQDSKNSSASDIAEIIDDFKSKHKLKGVVLDLRNNSGGLLPQAVEVTGLFINKGIVVSVKHSDGKIQHLRDLEGKAIWSGPLVVLTNKLSASAAEIVAQTLQDYGRAIVVGDEHTFGKGTFQTFTLDTGGKGKVNTEGEYKVTRGKYYTVSGKSPQLVGVRADVIVPSMFAYEEIGEQYTKYPLENDSISSQFEDDFSDISGLEFEELAWLYRSKPQTKLTEYKRHIPHLSANSKMRIDNNKTYQKFMDTLKDAEKNPEMIEDVEVHDFQQDEAINVMKDLIVLEPAA